MDRTTVLSRSQSSIPPTTPPPSMTTMRMPSVVHTAALSGVGAMNTGLTPTMLVERLPSIVNSDPVDLSEQCGPLTAWIAENPFLAALGLGVIAWFALKDK